MTTNGTTNSTHHELDPLPPECAWVQNGTNINLCRP